VRATTTVAKKTIPKNKQNTTRRWLNKLISYAASS